MKYIYANKTNYLCRYHVKCYCDFNECENNFIKACEWLESENKMHSLKEINKKMEELSEDTDKYIHKNN